MTLNLISVQNTASKALGVQNVIDEPAPEKGEMELIKTSFQWLLPNGFGFSIA